MKSPVPPPPPPPFTVTVPSFCTVDTILLPESITWMAVGEPVTATVDVPDDKVVKQISNNTVPSDTVTPPRVGSVHATVISPAFVPPPGNPITFSFNPLNPKLPTDTYSKLDAS